MRRCSRRQCSQEIMFWPESRFYSSVGLEPAEPVGVLAARVIFAADKTLVAEPVEFIEQERIVQFLAVGLIARGDAGDLDMTDQRHHLAQPHRNVAMDDLAVIDIELQLQVRNVELND